MSWDKLINEFVTGFEQNARDLTKELMDEAELSPEWRNILNEVLGSERIEEIRNEWWVVLGMDQKPATLREAKQAYRAKVLENHPDKGGDPNKMNEFNAAMAAAREELG